jgi:hypothetical protein
MEGKKTNTNRYVTRMVLSLAALSLIGCASTQRPAVQGSGEVVTVVMRETVNELEKEPVPGTVNEVWIEPMYDQVCVPGALDRNATYYRKPHCTLVEVRQEKFQQIEYPDYESGYAVPERPRGRMK